MAFSRPLQISSDKFYEVIIRLPSDIDQDVPGLSLNFVEWLSTGVWEPTGIWNMEHVNLPMVTLADKIKNIFIQRWNQFNQDETDFFFQLEEGSEYIHLHCCIAQGNVRSFVLGRYMSQIKDSILRDVYEGKQVKIPDWFSITKTKRGGQNKTVTAAYILHYLIPKKQPELQWAFTNMPLFTAAALCLQKRQELLDAFQESEMNAVVQEDQASTVAPLISNRATKNYSNLVDWLIEMGITSEKQWLTENKESYRSFQATSSNNRQVKAALENARAEMLLTKTATDYLIGKDPVLDITKNRIYQILKLNNYNPQYVGSILCGWVKREFNKRNAIWLYGPATTGKTNIAEAIAHAVPFYGCVNWTNENFPFNDCVDKMLIWWEEGKMTNKVVESAKAILGGSAVRVDQKCKGSVCIEPTPVIITSNTDMCMIVDGNSTTMEHRIPLEERMFQIVLSHKLEGNFGKISKKEVKEFFKWANDNLVPVVSEFKVPTNEQTKLAEPVPERANEPSEPPKIWAPPTREELEEILRASPELFASVAPLPSSPERSPERKKTRGDYQVRCAMHSLDNSMNVFECLECERANFPEFQSLGENFCNQHGWYDCALCNELKDDMNEIEHVFAIDDMENEQ
uniref:Rep1 protein n=1 Tax=Muscovy duck parvovirus TaxID=37325 RepID=A0A140HEY5_9VIRU|nr:Rep1 protein [Muscovy duck parvovirus]